MRFGLLRFEWYFVSNARIHVDVLYIFWYIVYICSIWIYIYIYIYMYIFIYLYICIYYYFCLVVFLVMCTLLFYIKTE